MEHDPFVTQLADLCRFQPSRTKWAVVPRHAVGSSLGDRIALGGQPWANLRFVTPLDLALSAAAPLLAAKGLHPLPDGLGPSLAMRLLLDLPAGEGGYFTPLADQPQMGAALWAALQELRLAGIDAEALPAAAFEDARKHRELRALLRAYEEHLAAARQADPADVYRAALARADLSPVAASDVLVESPELGAVPALTRAFLDALPCRRVPCEVPFVPGLQRPRRFSGCARAIRPAASRLAFLLDPKQAPPSRKCARAERIGPSGGPIELFHAAGIESEVEGVLRRVLGGPSTIPLDRVEVACASREYADLFWEKAQRLGLPVTIESGIPVISTRPVRTLLELCDWVESNFVAGRLRRLFQSSGIRIEFPDGGAGGQAASLLGRSGATWGRETYDRALASLAARYEAAAVADRELDEEERADLRTRAARASFLRDWIRDVLALFPAEDAQGTVPLSDLVNGLATLLDGCVAVKGPLDAAAVAVMGHGLANLLALGDLRRPTRQLLAFVREAVTSVSIASSPARPGHLHVSTLEWAGQAGRPFTFVVGLQEAGVFPPLLEDPVLLDAERRHLATSFAATLPTSHDRLAEAVYAVVSRLAVLPMSPGPADASPNAALTTRNAAVCLSYSCRDLRDGRETFPSWLMLQVLRLRDEDPGLTYDDLRQRLGTPESLIPERPDRALTDAAWWVASVKPAGEGAAEGVFEAFPSLEAGRRAMEARNSSRFTEWDGFVATAGARLDPRASGDAVSVTRLERLVSCPFRYFIEHGLGIDARADDDPGQDEWLDAMRRGAALHEVFARLGREARERGVRLGSSRDRSRAREVADETLQALRAECPPPSDVVFDRERAGFLRDVELFLEFESTRSGGEPVAFEVAFGHPSGGEEPLARAEPVTIPLGKGRSFLLRGTIDRIDRRPDGSYEVIDYKTGRFDPDRWRGTFRSGAMLQHALYGLAAADLLHRLDPGASVSHGVYEFPSARGGGERVAIPAPDRSALVQVLSDLFDVMAEGAFVPATDEKQCERCDFPRACWKPVAQAEAKLRETTNASLEPYRRLRIHE